MRTWLPEKETFKFRGYKRENLSIYNLNLFRKYYSSDKLHQNNSPSATIQHQPHSSGRDSEIEALFPQTGLTLFSTFSVFLKSNAGKGIRMVPSSRTSQLFLQMIFLNMIFLKMIFEPKMSQFQLYHLYCWESALADAKWRQSILWLVCYFISRKRLRTCYIWKTQNYPRHMIK